LGRVLKKKELGTRLEKRRSPQYEKKKIFLLPREDPLISKEKKVSALSPGRKGENEAEAVNALEKKGKNLGRQKAPYPPREGKEHWEEGDFSAGELQKLTSKKKVHGQVPGEHRGEKKKKESHITGRKAVRI